MKIRTKKQALAEAVRRWGKKAAVRDDGPRLRDGTPWPTPEERATLRAELEAHRAAKPVRPDITTFGDERPLREWRAALREFVEAEAAWKKREQRLSGLVRARRYSVGTVPGLGFWIEGEGDSWDEAFAEVDRKKARAAGAASESA